jgi:uncharacterized protein (DUF2062 family)
VQSPRDSVGLRDAVALGVAIGVRVAVPIGDRVALPIGVRAALSVGVSAELSITVSARLSVTVSFRLSIGVTLTVGRHVRSSDATSNKSSVEVLATWTPVRLKLAVDWTSPANKQLSTKTDPFSHWVPLRFVSKK